MTFWLSLVPSTFLWIIARAGHSVHARARIPYICINHHQYTYNKNSQLVIFDFIIYLLYIVLIAQSASESHLL